MSDSEQVLRRALREAVVAFAQYAEDTNHPSQEAIEGFEEGFLQTARMVLRDEILGEKRNKINPGDVPIAPRGNDAIGG